MVNRRSIYLLTAMLLQFFISSSQEEDSKRDREKILTRSLSYLSTGNSFSSLGNFAAISTDDKTIKGSVFILTEDSGMFTFTVEAGATDGIGTLFNEGSQGANVGIGFEYRHLVHNKKGYVSPGKKALGAIELERNKINSEYYTALASLMESVNSIERSKITTTINKDTTISTYANGTEIRKFLPEEFKTKQQIEVVLRKFYDLGSEAILKEQLTPIKKELEDYKDSLNQQLNKSIELIVGSRILELREARKKKIKELEKKEYDLKAKLIDLEYFAIGARASNKSFRFFDESLDFEDQIETRDYTSKEILLSYSSVRNMKDIDRNSQNEVTDFEPGRLRFFSLGSQLMITDNQGELIDVEVQDSEFDNSVNERRVVRKQNVKSGDYRKDLKAVTFTAEYYQFLSYSSNSVALHLNPRYLIKESSKPVTQFQVGLLFPFKKKDEEKTVVNIEIFYLLRDVFDTLDKFEDGFFKRNIVGIQTSFPFNF